MDSKETPIDDASIGTKTSGEREEGDSIEMKKEDNGEAQYSLLEQVDRLLRFGVSDAG